jgi:glycosyltransferase involved in cell wall biosynthesis
MRILCVIDSLGSGGAQRQLTNLACGLRANGHQVELLVYRSQGTFHRSQIEAAGIPIHTVSKGAGFSWKVPRAIAALLHDKPFDAVVSYLDSSNVYAALGVLLSRRAVRLIVSERTSYLAGEGRISAFIRRVLYIRATWVVANSHSQADHLRTYSWLRGRVTAILNGYNLWPLTNRGTGPTGRALRLLVLGRVGAPEKNGLRLLQALQLFRERHGYVPAVAWAGRQEPSPRALAIRSDMDRFLGDHPEIHGHWEWLGERRDVEQLLAAHDALVHVSLFEGLPNAICEAFVAGRPVVASAVCDHPRLVEEGARGFLCDPHSPESICHALERLAALSPAERDAVGRNARMFAEQHLALSRMVARYEALLSQ